MTNAGTFNVSLKGVSVLSLDVFDTSLLRRVAVPVGVFDLIEQQLFVDLDLRRLSGGSHGFRKLRVFAETLARDNLYKVAKTSEVNLDEIYAVLARLANLEPELTERLKGIELQAERSVCIANPEILALSEHARAQNVPVIFVSDMYHSTEFISELLQNAGYDAPVTRVFVSSAYRTSKAHGNLYDIVVKHMDVPAHKFLHIGDNRESDVEAASRHKFRSKWYRMPRECIAEADAVGRNLKKELVRPQESVALGVRDAMLAKQFVSGSAKHRWNNEWQQLGYERAGILFAGFALWLVRQLQQDRIEHAIFLARDGYIMKWCFELIAQWKGFYLPSTYMYASRRALGVPAIISMDDADIAFLASGTHQAVRTYLSRAGLSPEEYLHVIKECGFTSLDDVIDSVDDWNRLREVFRRLYTVVLKVAASESKLVRQYMEQLSIPRTGNVALIDIGWHGSMQEAFERLIKLSGRSCEVTGYYLGLHEGAQARLNRGMKMKGYLTNGGEPAAINAQIMECVELYEFLFLAPHGTCLGYETVEGRIQPILDADDIDHDNIWKAGQLHQGMLTFLSDLQPLIADFSELEFDPEGAIFPYAQVVASPTHAEAALLGDLTHADGMGKSQRYYLARPPARGQRKEEKVLWAAGLRSR